MNQKVRTVKNRSSLVIYYAVGECSIKIPGSIRTVKGTIYEDDRGNFYAMESKEFDKTFVNVK